MRKYAMQCLGLMFAALTVFAASAWAGAVSAEYQRLIPVHTGKATAVAVDNAERIYAIQGDLNAVAVMDTESRLLWGLSDLPQPISVAVDDQGRIYIGMADTGAVEVYGSNQQRLFLLGTGEHEFIRPTAIAVTKSGTVYVADGQADLVKAYDSSGNRLFSFGKTGDKNGEFHYPAALAIDEANSEILVADLQMIQSGMGLHEGARIQVFTLQGIFTRNFGNYGIGEGLLIKPLGLAVDRSSRIFVSDSYQGALQVFDRFGTYLDTIYNLDKPLQTPLSLALGPKSNGLFISSLNDEGVQVYGLPKTHVVRTSAGAGGTISPLGEISVEYGKSLSLWIKSNTGYHITDVLVDGVSAGVISDYTFPEVVFDHTVEARFGLNQYTIQTRSTTGGTISPAGSSQVNYGQNATYTMTANTGYELRDVVVDGLSKGAVASYTFNKVELDHTIEARFGIKQYTIQASTTAGGAISPAGVLKVNSGANATYIMTADTGYEIKDVLVDGISKGAVATYTFSKVAANHTIEARFGIRQFTIQASSNSGGTITPAGALKVNYGANATFTMTANTGYELKELLVDGISKGAVATYTFSKVAANHTIEARFGVKQYTIQASSNTGGTITPAGLLKVNYDQNVTYTMTPSTGYELQDVLVDGLSKGAVPTYTFSKVAANHFIEVRFGVQVVQHELSIDVYGSGTVTGAGIACPGDCTESYTAGTEVVLVAVPAAGQIFTGWQGDCSGVLAECRVTMDRAKVVGASFVAEANLDTFEPGNLPTLPWISGGEKPWGLQDLVSHSGNWALATSGLSEEGLSYIEVRLETVQAGEVVFWSKVSSSSGMDYLRFRIDGEQLGQWSGERGWAEDRYEVEPGQHLFRWEYVRGTGAAAGADTTWLDDVSFPTFVAPVFPAPDVKMNDSDGPMALGPSDSGAVSVAVAIGDRADEASEWFLLMKGPRGWSCYDPASGTWQRRVKPFHTGDLAVSDYAHQEVVALSGLDPGAYTIYFLVDMEPNGRVSRSAALVDTVVINVGE